MAIDIKSLLVQAFINLSGRKNLNKITVADLLSATGMARRTFYSYFRDKQDLIRWIYVSEIIGEDNLKNYSECYLASEAYYQKLCFHKDFMKQACLMECQNCLRESMYEIAEDYLRRAFLFRNASIQLSDYDYLRIKFFSCSLVKMSIDWIIGSIELSPHDMSSTLHEIVNSGLRNIDF